MVVVDDRTDNNINRLENLKDAYIINCAAGCKVISGTTDFKTGSHRKAGPQPLGNRMNGHHLILGKLTDFITGETLKDTHDERYRQKIAQLLVRQLGYLKADIEPRKALIARADRKKAVLKIDFTITLNGRTCMVLQYGPGSLVTRRRAVLAVSRLIAPYQVPVAVITNGKDAEIVNASSGEVTASGLESIPPKLELTRMATGEAFEPISGQRAEMESRILYCYEVDDRCECDDDVCRL